GAAAEVGGPGEIAPRAAIGGAGFPCLAGGAGRPAGGIGGPGGRVAAVAGDAVGPSERGDLPGVPRLWRSPGLVVSDPVVERAQESTPQAGDQGPADLPRL